MSTHALASLSSYAQARRRYGEGFAPPHRKTAAVGGEQETPFEVAFATLAYQYLKDKAPKLLPHLVGFQLIDRNDDNTKALAVFGFNSGKNWYYAPIFFLSGELKGHELLYLRNQDLFVPLKENWIGYILGQEPYVLGEPEPRNVQELGILAPDLRSLAVPPPGKMASALPRVDQWPEWAQRYLPNLAILATRVPGRLRKFAGLSERLSLDHVLAEEPLLRKAAETLYRDWPEIGRAMDHFYGPDLPGRLRGKEATSANGPAGNLILEGPVTARKAPQYTEVHRALTSSGASDGNGSPLSEGRDDHDAQKQGAIVARKVSVTLFSASDDPSLLTELDESRRTRLLRDGFIVEDRRGDDEVSRAYADQFAFTLTNPTSTGMYDVVMDDGDVHRCLVLHRPLVRPRARSAESVVVLWDHPRRPTINAYLQNIFVQAPRDMEDFRTAFDQLQDERDEVRTQDEVVIVDPRGNSAGPLHVDHTDNDGWGVFEPSGDPLEPLFPTYHDPRQGLPVAAAIDEPPIRRVRLLAADRSGSRLRVVSGCLFVPASAKVIRVNRFPESSGEMRYQNNAQTPHPAGQATLSLLLHKQGAEGSDEEEPEEYIAKQIRKHPWYYGATEKKSPRRSAKAAFALGNADSLRKRMLEETDPLKVYHAGTEVRINDAPPMAPKTALCSLVRDHGLRLSQAKTILKQAAQHRIFRCRIKYAQPYPLALSTGPGPSAPVLPPQVVQAPGTAPYTPQVFPQAELLQVPGTGAQLTNPTIYDSRPEMMPDPLAMQTALAARQTGQKEVFDTAILASLLKSVRQDGLVERFMPDLFKALDRLGRILFLFYWHNEEFADRYGKGDMPELENTLRNAFEMLGDLILFLKEKDVSPLAGMQNMSPTVEETGVV